MKGGREEKRREKGKVKKKGKNERRKERGKGGGDGWLWSASYLDGGTGGGLRSVA